MVVVPDQAGALVVGVVVLRLARQEARVEQLVDIASCTLDTRAVLATRGKPGERAAVTDPRCEPTVQVSCGRVLALLRVREVGAGVDRQDVLRWQRVRKRDLDRHPTLRHDNAAEVPLGLRSAAQWHGRVVAPQRRRAELGV